MWPGGRGKRFEARREEMVRRQIERRGIRDARVLAAFRKVPRERFVPEESRGEAYEDHPVAIGRGQTVSQPYIVALMLAELRLTGSERVLEVGTGSGYEAALLAELCAEVYTIERIPALAESAEQVLRELGYGGIHFRVGDGTLGWPDAAPFDGIVVSAAGPRVPETLKAQLAEGGRMIIPAGGAGMQELYVLERKGDEFVERTAGPCVFVKLVGKEGWGESSD